MPETVATASKSNWIISIWHSSLFWNLSKGVCQDLLGLPNTGQPELPSIFIAKGEEMRGESALCLLYRKCRYMSILNLKNPSITRRTFYLSSYPNPIHIYCITTLYSKPFYKGQILFPFLYCKPHIARFMKRYQWVHRNNSIQTDG